MSEFYGFAGKILYVDLSTGSISTRRLDVSLVEQFIGGMGLNSWLLYSVVKRRIDPFSPENALIFGVGPLVGTLCPGAPKVYVASLSPDGFLCQSSAGHSMGIMMKYAGYDHLVITGCAKKPVYLRICDDEVSILDADHLWGRDTWDTTDCLVNELGDYWVDCIGPAGETGVRYSIIMCGKRSSFNKTGPGTIMGSKNLKAIAVRGSKGVRVADPEEFKRLTDQITKMILADAQLDLFRTYGSPPAESQTQGFTYEEFVGRVAKRSYACLGCPVACKHIISLRGGAYNGLTYRVSHLDALSNHNRLAGLENWDELVKCVELENRLGVEAAGTAGMLRYIVECYRDGILDEEELDSIPNLGGQALRDLILSMMLRKKTGALAMKGLFKGSYWVGKGSEKYALHMKGVGREHRLEKEVSLNTIGSLTNPRGGDGDLTKIYVRETGKDAVAGLTRFCTDLGLKKMTSDRILQGSAGFNVGRLTKWAEDYSVVYVSMGFCHRWILRRYLNLEKLCGLFKAASGLELSPSHLLAAGERVFNIFKAFNTKMGATRVDDLPSRGAAWSPERPLVVSGKHYGTLSQVLDEYYDERGWQVKSGLPSKARLSALGLQDVAKDVGV